MGKKNNLGRALIKDKFANQRLRHCDSSLHTTELDDGYDWNRLNLKSVTEENTLDEFLTTAELAGTEFIAEKSNVSIVSNTNGLNSPAEELRIRQTQDAHRKELKIPRRPAWDSTTTPEQLDKMEREAFLEWRRSLAKLQEIDGIVMTPYERNLDFWRQLWRVIERSDVVIQIVDARNPLLFRCEDLEDYVREVNPRKISMILINKADYLNENQRVFWASYFDSIGVRVAFWSAAQETERLKHEENDGSDQRTDSDRCSDVDEDEDEDEDNDSDDSNDEGTASGQNSNVSSCGDSDGWETVDEDSCSGDDDDGKPKQRINGCHSDELSKRTTDRRKTKQLSVVAMKRTSKNHQKTLKHRNEEFSTSEATSHHPVKNSPDVLTGPQLIDLFESVSATCKSRDEVTTVGMIGYPNVGKSSTINALMRTKRVSVSATPGHTKHFQTMNLTPSLMLCDCPGLVMPSFVSTKADMIVCGILPVDQMRDFVPPVSLVCKNINRDVLETVYGIILPQPSEDEDPNRCPTAYELLGAYARVRGFMTHKGIPDYQRAARCILKDYITGKLLHCEAPPGVDRAVYEPTQTCTKTKKAPSVSDKKHVVSDFSSASSQQDAAFFSQVMPRVRSGGVGGVVGFTRTHGFAGHHMSNSGGTEAAAATTAAGGKPSKRHNNSNKREKLRRITSYLDA